MKFEERLRRANKELKESMNWFNEERRRIYKELGEKQGAERKFDGGNEPYRELHKEFARRMTAIIRKYDLPPDTRLNL